jgi:hypothetical protein
MQDPGEGGELDWDAGARELAAHRPVSSRTSHRASAPRAASEYSAARVFSGPGAGHPLAVPAPPAWAGRFTYRSPLPYLPVEPVRLANSAGALTGDVVRLRSAFAVTIQGHERLAGVPTAAANPADVDPARPGRRAPKTSNCWYCGTRWPSSAGRSTAPGCNPPTAWCWRHCRDCCAVPAGRSSSSGLGRYCAGIASCSPDSGPIRTLYKEHRRHGMRDIFPLTT